MNRTCCRLASLPLAATALALAAPEKQGKEIELEEAQVTETTFTTSP